MQFEAAFLVMGATYRPDPYLNSAIGTNSFKSE